MHCFHAHYLLFPGADDISMAAASYYGSRRKFESAAQAMQYAGEADNYLYISPLEHEHIVLTDSLNAPRQLARTLVALATENGKLSDWQLAPQRARALEIAAGLRELFRDALVP
jgi:hypothetical protein